MTEINLFQRPLSVNISVDWYIAASNSIRNACAKCDNLTSEICQNTSTEVYYMRP